MDRSTALEAIRAAAAKAVNAPVEIGPDTDLVGEEILDSLDAMVFLLELEETTGLGFPEDADLVELGAYRVPTLVDMLVGAAAR